MNQANISITATRWCNRRCTHCYIDPAELANPTQMDETVFRSVFDSVASLVALDTGLEEVEWELIGGEITKLPVEYWERNLPYALTRCREFNTGFKTPGSINVLTNLIFANDKHRGDYVDLFNKYGDWPEMAIYTSWEPDTNRFGKNLKLMGPWAETVRSIKAKQKILDVILTKTTVAMGPDYLLETFLPLGITDFSIKMISPYGSGRTFWQPNMVAFKEMSDYLCRLFDIAPPGITFTPADEMSGAVFRGTSYQCIGNFRYDLAVEPDGLTTFNANQTTGEAALGDRKIYVGDSDWAYRVLADNTQELDNKLSRYHSYCFQCEFHSACAGGWYHYRIAEPADVRAWDSDDCPGYKQLWRKVKARHGSFDPVQARHNAEMKALVSLAKADSHAITNHHEPAEDGPAFAEWLKETQGGLVEVTAHGAFDKPLIQRLWAYQAVGAFTSLSSQTVLSLSVEEQRVLVEHLVYQDLPSVSVDPQAIWAWVDASRGDPLADLMARAEVDLHSTSLTHTDILVAGHNTELVRWVLRHCRRSAVQIDEAAAHPVVGQLSRHIELEARARGRFELRRAGR
ncbi:radical SAM protein [Pseudomonas arcuscaelestis]|nr:radical SAM protein [Pseudomonas arcuscaelestis]